MEKPTVNVLTRDVLEGVRLLRALARLLHDSSASRTVVLGTLAFACGRVLADLMRGSDADFERCVELVVRNVRRAALGALKQSGPAVH